MSKKARITLSPFGRNVEESAFKIRSTVPPSSAQPAPNFDWTNALVDGFIIAMITFFTTLGGVTATGANINTILISSAISATAQFFVLLAVKRGIRAPTTA